MTESEDQIMELACEYLEGYIQPQRFRQLEKLMKERPKARAIYRDMILLRSDLQQILGQNQTPHDTSIAADACT